jgi:hypothetical protein
MGAPISAEFKSLQRMAGDFIGVSVNHFLALFCQIVL